MRPSTDLGGEMSKGVGFAWQSYWTPALLLTGGSLALRHAWGGGIREGAIELALGVAMIMLACAILLAHLIL